MSCLLKLSPKPVPTSWLVPLLLTLSELPESKSNGVSLVNAKRSSKDASASVSFSLNWTLDSSTKPTVEQLEALGAMGMAARLRMLEKQGVQF